jgi:hypothetical protein
MLESNSGDFPAQKETTMPKKPISQKQASLSGIEPPSMKAKKVNDDLSPISNAPQEAKVVKPDSLEIAFIQPPDENADSIPDQKEHFQLPTRFGAIPIDEAPYGWEIETRRHEVKVTKFQHAYPTIRLPFQEVQRVEFGHSEKFAPRERERERE